MSERSEKLEFTCKKCLLVHPKQFGSMQVVCIDCQNKAREKWRSDNPNYQKQYAKTYKRKPTEKRLKSTRVTKAAWRKANPDKWKEQKARRRAKFKGSGVPAEEWEKLVAQYAGKCAYCPADWDTVDHVIPVSRGGGHCVENVVPACRRCNSSKGNKLLSEWHREEP